MGIRGENTIEYHPRLSDRELERRLDRHGAFFGPKLKGEGAYFIIRSPLPAAIAPEPPARPGSLESRWFDSDYRARELVHDISGRHYAGDAVPSAYLNFGSGNLAGLFSPSYRLDEETIWFDDSPPATDIREIPLLPLDFDGRLFRAVSDTIRKLGEISKGRFVLGMTDIGSNLDVLFSLMPKERALKDMRKNPGGMRNALARVTEGYLEYYRRCRELMGGPKSPVSAFNQMVFRGHYGKVMSESSVMISPAHFGEFVLPTVERQATLLERIVFNLDPVGHARLLPGILGSEFIRALEWNPPDLPGDDTGMGPKDYGSAETARFANSVLESGKKLILRFMLPEQAVELAKKIPSDGVVYSIHARDPSEAERTWELLRHLTAT
ncbi:MAG: hypothetical protein LBF41_08145 [Deltaproteobacteria bacterium]|nr:hypothetical protein [Deltaproteobacteria bacterium]